MKFRTHVLQYVRSAKQAPALWIGLFCVLMTTHAAHAQKLWLGNDTGGDVFQTTATGTVISDVGTMPVTGIAWDGKNLYFSDSNGNITKKTSDGTSSIGSSFLIPSVDVSNNPAGPTEDMAWDSKRGVLWRVIHSAGTLQKIDPVAHSLITSYALPSVFDGTLGGVPGALGIAYDSKRDLLYVSFCATGCANNNKGLVDIANPNTGTITGTLFYTSTFYTGGLAYDPTTDTLWVGDFATVRNMDLAGNVLSSFARPLPGGFVDGLEFVQSTPTSGALLTLSDNSGNVLATIYDSQIHSGNLHTTPCDPGFPTDAFVLQGGSWTGCDPGDAFETGQTPGQAKVTAAGITFNITTRYSSGGCTTPGVTPPICAGPDTGFLDITNSSAATDFAGTITLSGTAVNILPANASFCPPTGSVSDSITGLLHGASATLALSTDSSNCGGFNATQSSGFVKDGTPTVFQVGSESFTVTTSNAGVNTVSLTLLPLPVPAGPLGSAAFNGFGNGRYGNVVNAVGGPGETPTFTTSFFSATNFPNEALIANADVSAAGNPVGMEFHLGCSPAAVCPNVLYGVVVESNNDPNSLPNPIGGVALLQATGNNDCSAATNNIFFSYFSAAPLDGPIRGGGNPLGGCYAATFDPNAAPVPVGQTETQKTFVGFQAPVSDCTTTPCVPNLIKAGQGVPWKWQSFSDSAGTVPITDLNLCTDPTTATCTGHWVFAGTIPINCSTDASLNNNITADNTAGASGLQFDPTTNTYTLVWKTSKTASGCVSSVMGFYTGPWFTDQALGAGADFKFTH